MSKTVLITRPQPAAERTAKAVRAMRAKPIVSPVMEIVSMQATLPEDEVEGLLLTSQHSVHVMSEQLGLLSKTLPVIAAGHRSAHLMEALGFSNVHHCDGHPENMPSLANEVFSKSARLLWLRGREIARDLHQDFASTDHDIISHIVYEAKQVAHLSDEAIEALKTNIIDAAVHFSARSAQSAFQLAKGAKCLTEFQHIRHFCLSESIANTLQDMFAKDDSLSNSQKPDIKITQYPRERALLAFLSVK